MQLILQEQEPFSRIHIIGGEETTTLKFIPAYSNFAGVSKEDKAPSVYGAFESGPRYEEYVEVGEFSINGQPYTLRSLDVKSTTSKTLRLRQGYQYLAIQVQGDSMEPTILNGEYVLIRGQKQSDRDGQVVAVNIGHQTVSTPTTALVKRLSKIRGGVRLESDNPKYPHVDYVDVNMPLTVIGVAEGILTPVVPPISKAIQEDQKESTNSPEETAQTDPDSLEMVASDQLRMTVSLPSLIPVREFLDDILHRLESIDALYLLFSLIAANETDTVRGLVLELTEDKNPSAVIKSVLQKREVSQVVKPLQLIRSHYGSDAVNDLLGFGKILEIIVSIPERIRKGKLEEEILKRDIKLKDEEILTKQKERIGLDIKNFGELIAASKKGQDCDFSPEELRQLYELATLTALPLIDPPTHDLARERPLLPIANKPRNVENEPKALASPKTKSANSNKKARRRNR